MKFCIVALAAAAATRQGEPHSVSLARLDSDVVVHGAADLRALDPGARRVGST